MMSDYLIILLALSFEKIKDLSSAATKRNNIADIANIVVKLHKGES